MFYQKFKSIIHSLAIFTATLLAAISTFASMTDPTLHLIRALSHNTPQGTLVRIEARDLVVGAPQLERERRLLVLALEQDVAAEALRQALGSIEWCFSCHRVDVGGQDALEVVANHRVRRIAQGGPALPLQCQPLMLTGLSSCINESYSSLSFF